MKRNIHVYFPKRQNTVSVCVCMSVGTCARTFYERCAHVNFSYLFLLLVALFFWFMYYDSFFVAL